MYLVTFLFVVLATTSKICEATILTSYSPGRGSGNGQTTVKILGVFDNPFQPIGPIVNETEVLFVGTYQEYICDLEKDSTHETQITCYTRPMPYGYYWVCVQTGAERSCFPSRFYVDYWYTPKIWEVYVANISDNLAGTPRDLITVVGDIFTDIYSPNDVRRLSSGNDRLLRRILAGSADCSLTVEGQSDELYELRFDPEEQMIRGVFICKPESNFVGYSNLTFIVSEMGLALPLLELQVSAWDTVYMFQTYAIIYEVSPNLGSVMGDTEITIFGNYFGTYEQSPADVTINGQPCSITSQNDTEIRCITPPEPSDIPTIYSGSRGVLVEQWDGQYFFGDLNTFRLQLNNETAGYSSWYQDSTGYQHTEAYTTVKMSGILEILKSDFYRFVVRCDDLCDVYIGSNSSDLVRVIDTTYTRWSWTSKDSQTSDWFYYEEGETMYYEAIGVNGVSAGDLSVGLVRGTSTLTNSQSESVIDDEQVYYWSASAKRDIQHVSLINWSPGVGVDEQQTITVESNCFQSGTCGATFYEISYNGLNSGPIAANAPAFVLQLAIQGMAISGVTVTVTEQPINDVNNGDQIGITYEVTFAGGMGDEAELFATAGSNEVNVVITESVTGLANFENFALVILGRTTEALPVDASSDDVEEAILETRKAKCPAELLGVSSTISYHDAYDFEGTRPINHRESGGRRSNREAFCGINCMINPYFIFDISWPQFSIYDVADYPVVCFARFGLFDNRMRITFDSTYVVNNKTRRRDAWFFNSEIAMFEDQWQYECFNLQSAITQKYPNERDIKIRRFGGFNRVSSEYDFFIDTVIIASSEPDLSGLMRQRIPPVMWQGQVMSGITVYKTNESVPDFEIAITPYNCAHDLPLISVYNVRDMLEYSEDFSSSSSTNGASDVLVNVSRTERTNLPMSGTFDMDYMDDVIGYVSVQDIPAQITVADLETRLEAVEGFGDMSVSRYSSDTCFRRRFTVKWISNGGRKGDLLVDPSNLSGDYDLSYSYRHISGGVRHGPLHGDMTRLTYDTPQVEVKINGIQSLCMDDCSFVYSEEATPEINGISPDNGDVPVPVTITGTNLDGDDGTHVLMGNVECDFLSQSESSIVCTPGEMEYGDHKVYVFVGGKGLARSSSPVTYRQNVQVSGASPTSGFSSGGIPMTVSGSGLGPGVQVYIGDELCPVVSANATTIVCTVPMSATTGSVPVTVQTDSDTITQGSYNYDNTGLPVVTSVQPTSIYGTGGIEMNITGTGLGDTVSGVTVMLGSSECEIVTISETSIVIITPYLPSGSYELEILYENIGLADTSANSIPDIEYVFTVTGIEPTHVSLFGGSLVTLSGNGFRDDDIVAFGDIPCNVDTATQQTLTCTIGTTAVTHVIENTGVHAIRGIGYAWSPTVVTITQGDTVEWKWNLEVQYTQGIMVYETDGLANTNYNGGFTSPARTQQGIFRHKFNTPGTYFFSTGTIENLNFGSLSMDGAVNVVPFSDVPASITVANNDIDAFIDIAPFSEPPGRFVRSVSCSPLNSGVPGCDSRKKRDTVSSRQRRSVGTLIPMTPTIIGDFIHGHNYARKIATPSGSNIILARWDEELATRAQFLAAECQFEHSSGNTHSVFGNSVGENIAALSAPRDIALLVNTTLMAWIDNEKIHYTFSNGSCSDVCGHYTQAVWFDSYAVGCGIADCTSNYTIFCQYGYAGNDNGGGQPYTAGTPCTNCPSGFSECDDVYRLCVEPGFTPVVPEPPAPEENNTGIIFSTCYTPTVTSISPRSGTVNDIIEIEGSGFGNDSCRVTVMIGDDITCVPTFTNSSFIQCSPLAIADAEIAIAFEVEVTILGYGNAFIDINDDMDRRFALLPSVESYSPDSGSIDGGTLLYITGTGFYQDVTVYIGAAECSFSDISYHTIGCVTPQGTTGTQAALSVMVGSYEAVCDMCMFEYSSNQTSVVTGVQPAVINSDNTLIRLTGSNFFQSPIVILAVLDSGLHLDGRMELFEENVTALYDLGSVASIVGGQVCVPDGVSENEINCTLSQVSAGHHQLTVLNPVQGFSQFATSRVITGAAIASLDTTIGGTGGGLEVTVNGHGFMSGFLTVTVDNVWAEIDFSSVSNTQFKFITPPGEAGVSVVQIISQSLSYPPLSFEYSSALTPTITDISPSSGDVGTSVDLTGTMLNGSAFVSFGDAPCSVTFQNDTLITCTVSQPSFGSLFPPSVFIVGLGFADHNLLTFNYTMSIVSFDPQQGSLGGGNMLAIYGSGFHFGSTVYVGNSECSVVNVTYNVIDCEIEETPSMETREDHVTSFHVEFEGQNITVFESVPYDFHYALGQAAKDCMGCENDIQALTTATGAAALQPPAWFTTIDLGTFTLVIPNPSSRSYICLGTLLMENPVDLSALDKYMCVHYMLVEETTAISSTCTTSFSLCMWEIDGSPFTTFTDSVTAPTVYKLKNMAEPIADINAPIEVNLAGPSLFAFHYVFTSNLTPVVTGVTPSRGGTGGGTNITITGTGFSNTANDVTVTIDGVACDVQTSTLVQITCTTNSNTRSIKTSVVVEVQGKGRSLDVGAQFFYVDVWSSIYTWGGRGVPGEKAIVEIPTGQDIMIDQDTEILSVLLIKGGRVFFDEKDIELNVERILIMDGGRLEVGTEDRPFEHKGIITLHGHVRSIELPIYGSKCIGIREGTLDLHGKHIPITWTTLTQTADAGQNTIVVKDEVTWEVGDKIAIASTGDRRSQNENEELTIQSIDADRVTIRLVENLKYRHLGEIETLQDGTVIKTRAEVGLLTRNVVVRGSRHAEWDEQIPACPEGFNPGEFAQQTCFQGRFGEERGSDQYGAQILFHHPSQSTQEAFGRIEYVEMSHMGQAFRLGRYAIHYHLMGDMEYRNYVRGCSIHESFNRAVTIHDTHKALIERNVVYNAMGGCIFIEDGTETENIIRENLIIFCRQSTSLQNEDITPAAIWVTNPNNIIEHNAAAGGTHFGYWYRMHTHPSGPSTTNSICPRKVELGSFYNNTAHSLGWFGLWLFQEYTPVLGSCCSCFTNAIAAFRGLTAWHCDKGAEFVGTGSVQLRDSIFYNNRLTGIEVKMMIRPEWGEAGIYDSVIAGYTSVSGPNEVMKSGVTLPYSDGWEVNRVTFINFDRNGGTVFSTATITGTCAANCGGFHARFENLVYYNVDNIGYFRWEHENYIEDVDGTLTGTGSSQLVIAYTETAPPSCVENPQFSLGPHPGMVCPPFRLHRLAWNNVLPSSLDGSLANLTNVHGTTQVPFEKKRMTHAPGWMALLFDGMEYEWIFHHLPKMSNITYSALFSNYRNGECNIISHRLTSNPDRFNIVPGQNKNSSDSPVACGVNEHGDYYFDDTEKTLQYIITGESLPGRRRRAIASSSYWADPTAMNRVVNMNTYRCYFEDCIPPPDPNTIPPARQRPGIYDRWSDTGYWPGAVLPVDGEDVTIPTGDWVVADMAFPNISTLFLDGVLELENVDENTGQNRNFVLRVEFLVIRGGRLIIGWEDNKFLGLVDIILTGTRDSDELDLTDDVALGAKAIGAFGGLDIHGADVATPWTHLGQTALIGSNEIILHEVVDWEAGQDILITPTGFNPWEAETFMITGVREDPATNNTVLELNDTLQYNHLAKDYSYDNASFSIIAEVALLSRNIRIIGEEYADSDQESFGGRILVGKLEQSSFTFIGYARIQNAQFIRMGQEGYSEKSDPRFALAYSNTGTQNSITPSYVKKCTFVRNFNTAYGAFGANGITFSENVIYHTVGPSIWVDGTNNRVENNLVSLMINPGTYNGKTNFIWYWFGAIQVYSASDVFLGGNVVAGSERAAYWIGGEKCGSAKWGVNVARASLYGVYLNRQGNYPCTRIQNFRVHHSYDFGIYYQDASSLEIENCIVSDCGVGIITLFNGPSSTTHEYEDKHSKIFNVAVVALTESGICPTIDTTAGFMQSSPNARPPNKVVSKTIGILAPSFMSAHNIAPKKPFPGLMQYPALGGRMMIEDCAFINFGSMSCNYVDHVVLSTNKMNEDYQHPIFTSRVTFENTPNSCKVFYDRPSLGHINPSDCVDMECDGLKNFIITDKDGSFFEGSPGDIIAQAEYEWGGDPSRGLGDYRIPVTLQTHPNGSQINVDDIAPKKGILRANTNTTTCVYHVEWQAYECHGYDHQLFIIESLDADSETRRLSPVAMLSEGYIDLENGPQDHGWCAGYTCQLRLSTFFTTTAIGYQYEIHFTGTSPNQLRLRLPHAGPDDAIVACIYYSTSNRLDVYYNHQYVLPTNGYYQGAKVLTNDAPENQPDLYQPNVTSPAATNHYKRYTQTICVTVRGSEPVDIKVSQMIYLGFGVPDVTVDEFFDDILNNLALLLGVPLDNVWVVDVVREGSRRRRKRENWGNVIIGIGDPPAQESPITEPVLPRSETVEDENGTVTILNPGEPDNATVDALEELEAIRTALEDATHVIAATIESGNGEDIFGNLSVVEITVFAPPPIPTADNPANETVQEAPTPLAVIDSMEIIVQPYGGGSRGGERLQISPVVGFFDTNGNAAHPQTPWVITAVIVSGDPTATIISGENETVVNGEAEFSDLIIDEGGPFVLLFTASYDGITSQEFTAVSDEFVLRPPRVPTNCTDEEEDAFFDKEYVWEGDNCTHLCTYNCDGLDEHCVDVTTCGSHAECIENGCECGISDFDPNLPENLDRVLEPYVTCGSSFIQLTINKCGANAIGFNLAKMFVFGDGPVTNFHQSRGIHSEMERLNLTDHPYACQGIVENTAYGLKYIYKIRSNLNQCNPEVVENGTHITYHHILRGFKTERRGYILRDRPIEVAFSCSYESNVQDSLPSPIESYISVISLDVESGGQFNITMSLWEDEQYTVPMQSPATVLVPDPLYLAVVANGVNNAVLSVASCSAHSSQDPATALSALLIEDGCPNDAAGVVITEIGTSNEVKFWFPSFLLTSGNATGEMEGSLYVECHVIVCSDMSEACVPNCNDAKRKKRDVQSQSIGVGPIPIGRTKLAKGKWISKRYATGQGKVQAKWIH